MLVADVVAECVTDLSNPPGCSSGPNVRKALSGIAAPHTNPLWKLLDILPALNREAFCLNPRGPSLSLRWSRRKQWV